MLALNTFDTNLVENMMKDLCLELQNLNVVKNNRIYKLHI